MTPSVPDSGPFPDVVVVLAGGLGRRLGGVDKGSLVVGSHTLLQRIVTAAAGRPVVVVGGNAATWLADISHTFDTDDTDVSGSVGRRPRLIAASEDPPGGGPAAGLAAGLVAWANAACDERREYQNCGSDSNQSDSTELDTGERTVGDGGLMAVVAVDYPGVTASTLARLARAVPSDRQSGAVLLADDRVQYGIGVFPLRALQRSAGSRDTWHGAPLRDLVAPIIGMHIPAMAAEAHDVDTPADLKWWQHHYRDGWPA